MYLQVQSTSSPPAQTQHAQGQATQVAAGSCSQALCPASNAPSAKHHQILPNHLSPNNFRGNEASTVLCGRLRNNFNVAPQWVTHWTSLCSNLNLAAMYTKQHDVLFCTSASAHSLCLPKRGAEVHCILLEDLNRSRICSCSNQCGIHGV